ncbi:hypothetical protein ABCR94_26305 [Streptomyces sp. 21So2-11]|uniref:hypothetical protein n=1 Tax=Streptomyces sp. 21So2-11 TaxID=3144408 RepID=UPI00321A60E3
MASARCEGLIVYEETVLLRKKNVLRAAAPIALLALALTACGPTDSSSDDKGKADPKPANGASEGTEPEEAGDDSAAGASLKPGESSTVDFKEDTGKFTYKIAAQKVEVGTEAEAQKLVSDPKDAEGLVVAVAHVKFTNTGGGVVKKSPDVGDETEIYADGTRGGLLIGSAEDTNGCSAVTEIENWKIGQSYTICETYMIPKDSKAIEVRWAEESGKTLAWTFQNK